MRSRARVRVRVMVGLRHSSRPMAGVERRHPGHGDAGSDTEGDQRVKQEECSELVKTVSR